MCKPREHFWDVVKFLAMMTVVFGHLGGRGIVDESPMPQWYGRAVLAVAMPLFFVISGYFAGGSFQKYPMSRIFGRAICFVWPQLVVGAMWALVAFCLSGSLCEAKGALRQMLAFWFLKNLSFIYLSCGIICHFCERAATRWLAHALVYAFLFFLPAPLCGGRLHWWIGVSIHMMPYFVFGLMVLRNRRWYENAKVAILCGLVFVGAVILDGVHAFPKGMLNYWLAETYWRDILSSNVELCFYFIRPVVGICGSTFVLWFVREMIRRVPTLTALSVFGTTTLGVYVFHEWPIVTIGGMNLSVLPLPFWSSGLLAVAVFLVCHYLVLLVRRSKVTKAIVFGDEVWMQRLFESAVRKLWSA